MQTRLLVEIIKIINEKLNYRILPFTREQDLIGHDINQLFITTRVSLDVIRREISEIYMSDIIQKNHEIKSLKEEIRKLTNGEITIDSLQKEIDNYKNIFEKVKHLVD